MFIFDRSIKINSITKTLFRGGKENKWYDNNIVENIVKRLEMILEKPEAKLCSQEEKNKDSNTDKIFFLAKGKCEVFVQDRFGNNRIVVKNVRTMLPGDNFGEISMLF